jgi:hypothetical protein
VFIFEADGSAAEPSLFGAHMIETIVEYTTMAVLVLCCIAAPLAISAIVKRLRRR